MTHDKKKVSVLFVCLGNICRSPSAEGVFNQMSKNTFARELYVDSAGTSGWHIGNAPDSRSIDAAQKRGYDLSSLRGRQVLVSDFERFDYILAMDKNNLSELENMRPADFTGVLALFLDYAQNNTEIEVPDPYYGSNDGFNHVLDLIEDASKGLIEDIRLRFFS